MMLTVYHSNIHYTIGLFCCIKQEDNPKEGTLIFLIFQITYSLWSSPYRGSHWHSSQRAPPPPKNNNNYNINNDYIDEKISPSLTSIPNISRTPYWFHSPHTTSRITVFRPGHNPPHVTMQARTSSGSNTICTDHPRSIEQESSCAYTEVFQSLYRTFETSRESGACTDIVLIHHIEPIHHIVPIFSAYA